MEKLCYLIGFCYGRCVLLTHSPLFRDLMTLLVLSLVLLAVFFCPAARGSTDATTSSAQCELILGGWSYHQDRSHGYNENHGTVGLECNDWVILTYNNSLNNRSTFVGRSIETSDTGLSFGAQYGLINGYNHGSSKPYPMAFPKISYGAKWGSVDVLTLPGLVTYAQLKFHLHEYTPTKRKLSKYASAVGYGTTGRSLSVSRRMSPSYDVELMGSSDSLKREKRGGTTNSDLEINVDFLTLRVNYYPWQNDFKLVAGIAQNKSSAKAVYSLNPDYPLPKYLGKTAKVLSALAGTATVEAEFDSYTPYLGVGWGNPWIDDRQLSMSVDLGAYHISKIAFTGSVDSPLAEITGYKARADAKMAEEISKLEEKFSDVKWWWNVAVNVRYRF